VIKFLHRGSLRAAARRHAASIAAAVFVAAFAVIAPALSRPQKTATVAALDLTFDPAKTEVHWALDTTLHMVHGTFKLKSGKIHYEPATGKASGEIIVDARTGESGSSGRDEKMQKDVLETARYPDIAFHPNSVKGNFGAAADSTLEVHGNFTLHGADHEMTIPVNFKRAGENWTSTSKFAIPFLSWGLKNPSSFLLKVKPDVEIELDGAGTLQ